MPFLNANGLRHYYRLEGAGGRPVLMLAHSLGLDHGMWELQTPDLVAHFRLLLYDIRGHGASEVAGGAATLEVLGRDALAIADGLGIEPFAFCGLSLGGMIGIWLAAHAPARLTHVVLANTTAKFADPAPMEARRKAVLESGMAPIADSVMQRFFSPAMLASDSPHVASARRVLLATDPAGYAACCAAIRDMDHTGLLESIRVPTLVIGGDGDPSTPWAGNGEILARRIPGARVAKLATAHLSNIERPRSFTAALLRFLLPAPPDARQAGLETRHSVLGAAHMEQVARSVTPFTRDFQDLITTYAFGAVWSRPGLDVRTRRLLALAITASLSRWEEFRGHLRCGLAAELEPCDVEELLLQAAIYAGVPAAHTGFQIAAEEIERSGKE